MSNEVAVIQQPKPMVNAGVQPRALVPSDIEGVWRVAGMLAASGMTPKDINTAEKISVAIMHGLEIGLTPMQALQSIAVVNGRPTIWGDAALALVRASGLMESFNEEIRGDGDNMEAICTVVRKGEKSPTIGRFSVADAKTSGLWTKTGYNGAKTPWQLYPKRMLQVRARGFALRDGFADVLKGLAIKEEMDDVQRLEEAQPTRALAPPPPTEVIEHSPLLPPSESESHAEDEPGNSTAGESSSAHEQEEQIYDWTAAFEEFDAALKGASTYELLEEIRDEFLARDGMPRSTYQAALTAYDRRVNVLEIEEEKAQAKLAEQESARKEAEKPAVEAEQSLADQSPPPVTKAPPPPSNDDDDFPGDRSSAAPKPPVDAGPTPAEMDIALAAQRDPAAMVRVMARKKAAAGTKKFNLWYKTISEADASLVDNMPDLNDLIELAHNVDAGAKG